MNIDDKQARLQPTALETLAAAGGANVVFCNFHPSICGLLMHIQKWCCIGLNASIQFSRLRFTFAHELAHLSQFIVFPNRTHLTVEEFLSRKGKHSRDATEKLCDKIAAEVLMPADLILLEVFQAGRVNSYTLARRFRVSLTAMRVRLRGLGLL